VDSRPLDRLADDPSGLAGVALPDRRINVRRRVGIGGVTPGAQGKAMADLIAARLAER